MIRKIVFALTIFLPFILFSGCIHGDYLNIEIPDDITIRYSDDHEYDCTYFNPAYYKTAEDTITGTITVSSGTVNAKNGYVAYTEYDSYTTHTNRRDYDFVLVDENDQSYSFSIDTYPGDDGYDAYCSKDFTLEGDFVIDDTTITVNSCHFVRTTF